MNTTALILTEDQLTILKQMFRRASVTSLVRKIWFLTFEEWLMVWMNSGYLFEKLTVNSKTGGPDTVKMKRIDIKKPYTVDNVMICKYRESAEHAVERIAYENVTDHRNPIMSYAHTNAIWQQALDLAKQFGETEMTIEDFTVYLDAIDVQSVLRTRYKEISHPKVEIIDLSHRDK